MPSASSAGSIVDLARRPRRSPGRSPRDDAEPPLGLARARPRRAASPGPRRRRRTAPRPRGRRRGRRPEARRTARSPSAVALRASRVARVLARSAPCWRAGPAVKPRLMPRGQAYVERARPPRRQGNAPDMLDTREPLVLHPADNVAILTARAPEGSRPLGLGVPLAAPVASGHKIAREPDRRGRRHRQVRPDHRLRHPADRSRRARPHPQLRLRQPRPGLPGSASTSRPPAPRSRRSTTASFQGYRRANGQVGTRNMIAVCATVNCSATVIRRAAEQVMRSGILADYPNVDGVVAFAHGTGCGMAAEGPGFDNLQRVLWGHATHPNVGAAVFVGLGCEVMQVGADEVALRRRPRRPLPRPDHPGDRRHDQDGGDDRRADPRAAARGEPRDPRAGARLRAQARAAVRRLRRLLRHHRQPRARRRLRPARRHGRHRDPLRDPGDLRRRAAAAAPRRLAARSPTS